MCPFVSCCQPRFLLFSLSLIALLLSLHPLSLLYSSSHFFFFFYLILQVWFFSPFWPLFLTTMTGIRYKFTYNKMHRS